MHLEQKIQDAMTVGTGRAQIVEPKEPGDIDKIGHALEGIGGRLHSVVRQLDCLDGRLYDHAVSDQKEAEVEAEPCGAMGRVRYQIEALHRVVDRLEARSETLCKLA